MNKSSPNLALFGGYLRPVVESLSTPWKKPPNLRGNSRFSFVFSHLASQRRCLFVSRPFPPDFAGPAKVKGFPPNQLRDAFKLFLRLPAKLYCFVLSRLFIYFFSLYLTGISFTITLFNVVIVKVRNRILSNNKG